MVYLNFQLDLARQQSKGAQEKQVIDGVKLLLRRMLEKFMADVVLAKLSAIEKSTSGLGNKIEKLL